MDCQQHQQRDQTELQQSPPQTRLGRLGIPLPSSCPSSPSSSRALSLSQVPGDEADRSSDSDSESLAANVASPLPPQASTSYANERGGIQVGDATRSRTNSSEARRKLGTERSNSLAPSLSEAQFRDIVDDLTVQNQQLKGRLRRYESAQVPESLKNERLFEVRFFESLPPARRAEIESFLQSYVQRLASPDIPSPPLADQADQGIDVTSSIGVTLRSLRSSEKAALREGVVAEARGEGTTGTDRSLSGSGGGNSGGSGDRLHRRVGQTSNFCSTAPPILRRHPDPFDQENEMLAAPSYSGVEPLSLSGTGTGMRISDPEDKGAGGGGRKRTRAATNDGEGPGRPNLGLRQVSDPSSASSRSTVQSKKVTSSDEETLVKQVVGLIERLFDESLPLVNPSYEPLDLSPPSTLHSDPEPLPSTSSSNTHYLGEFMKGGGEWIYLNLVCTWAGVHRLNISIKFIRAALRRSSKIELSEEGNKVRWRGPKEKVVGRLVPEGGYQLVDNARSDGEREFAERKQEEEMDVSDDSDQQQSDEGQPPRPRLNPLLKKSKSRSTHSIGKSRSTTTNSNSKLGALGHSHGGTTSTGGTGKETAATSLYLAPPSTDGKKSQISSSSLRKSTIVHDERKPGEVGGDDGGSITGLPIGPLAYVSLFGHPKSRTHHHKSTTGAPSSTSSSSNNDHQSLPPAKRRKRNSADHVGGLVFFAAETFCSDLGGDQAVRESLSNPASKSPPSSDEEAGRMVTSEEEEPSSDSSAIEKVRVSKSDTSPTISGGGTPPFEMEEVEEDENLIDEEDGKSGSGVELLRVILEGASKKTLREPDDEWHGLFRLKSLTLSGMGDVVPDDHFSILVKTLHPSTHSPSLDAPRPIAITFPFSPSTSQSAFSSPILLTKILSHPPSRPVRVPRNNLTLDDDSDTEAHPPPRQQARARLESPILDYYMSLALPLHQWAPNARDTDGSDEDEEGEAPISVE